LRGSGAPSISLLQGSELADGLVEPGVNGARLLLNLASCAQGDQDLVDPGDSL
jgi:hypothetical protein